MLLAQTKINAGMGAKGAASFERPAPQAGRSGCLSLHGLRSRLLNTETQDEASFVESARAQGRCLQTLEYQHV